MTYLAMIWKTFPLIIAIIAFLKERFSWITGGVTIGLSFIFSMVAGGIWGFIQPMEIWQIISLGLGVWAGSCGGYDFLKKMISWWSGPST